MLFNSLEFIVFFALVITTIVVIKNRKFQHLFLLAASYFFFIFSSNYLVSLLIFSTVLDFYIAQEIWKSTDSKKKKRLLIISIMGNLGLLGFFKYTDFGISQFNSIAIALGQPEIPLLNIILPIGISFYTFQTLSYTIDVYRGNLEPSKSFKEFALFVAFFPQLVAGPIVRAKVFLPQLREKMESGLGLYQIIIKNRNLKFGITLVFIGLMKKMFFADNIGNLVDEIFLSPIGHSSLSIILGTVAFGFQIYGDFSGYSDIAIGAALILGFKIPQNFNKPYFATSPVDFWRRWHISLSTWLRDYLYIPLGGNKKSKSRTYLNLLIVMFLGGLWHGAAWNFVVWGLLHGSYLAIHKILSNKFPSITSHPFFKTKIGLILSIFVTQYFVFLAWIPFRVSDTESMTYSIQKYIFLDFQILDTITYLNSHKIPVLILTIFVILHFISYRKGNLPLKISNWNIKYWVLFLIGIILSILFFYPGNPEDFIYFQF
mgnify:CR=1 FL=1